MSRNLVALRRKHGDPVGTSIVERLREASREAGGLDAGALRAAARASGLPETAALGVASFYADLAPARHGRRRVRACLGTACFARAGTSHVAALERALGTPLGTTRDDGEVSLEPAYCLGMCHAAPSASVEERGADGAPLVAEVGGVDAALAERIARGPLEALPGAPRPRIASFVEPTIVLRNLVDGADARTLAAARARGAYAALLDAAGARRPADVLDAMEASGLRGRGGAGYPTAQKWRFAAAQPAGERWVVCNADEGDPGSYIDLWLMLLDPHAVLEGMALAGLAVGAERGAIYVRSEYPRAVAAMRAAIREARGAGLLGAPLAGSSFRFDAEVVEGAGSYVCGEETALLRSVEGQRGMVSARPPFPAVSGAFGRPTIVNNVETLANVPWIVAHGGAAYARLGVGRSRGTKAVSLDSQFARPGLYEVALGTPLRTICDEIGGGLADGRAILGVQVGGPLGGIVPARSLDAPLGFEELDAVGGLLGHGGIVAFGEGTDMREVARHLFAFGDDESCGKCFPCRIGMRRGREIVDRMAERGGSEAELALLGELIETMRHGSLCAHGGGLPAPIRSILDEWRGDLLAPPRARTEAGR